jgi:hypothetical protein
VKQLRVGRHTAYAEVRYFCELPISGGRHLAAAVVSVLQNVRQDIHNASSGVLRLCRRPSVPSVFVVELPSIAEIVSMVPYPWEAGIFMPGEAMGRETDFVGRSSLNEEEDGDGEDGEDE